MLGRIKSYSGTTSPPPTSPRTRSSSSVVHSRASARLALGTNEAAYACFIASLAGGIETLEQLLGVTVEAFERRLQTQGMCVVA